MQRESGWGEEVVSTSLNEELENARELRVLVDVEEVREGLGHLPLLEETRRGPRARTLRREQHSCPVRLLPKPVVHASRKITQ